MVGNKPVTRSRAYCNLQEVLGAQSPRLSPTLLVRKLQVRVRFSQLNSPALQEERQQSTEVPLMGTVDQAGDQGCLGQQVA